MANSAYILFILGTFASAALLLNRLQASPEPLIKPIMIAILTVGVPFWLWDLWATADGHWAFNEKFILGNTVWGLPLEEWLFFIAVPLVSLSIWLLIHERTKNNRIKSNHSWAVVVTLIGVFFLLFASNVGQPYIQTVTVFGILTCFALIREGRLMFLRIFWLYILVMFGLFLVANSFLTALPVVTYGNFAINGFRVGSIPVEDFVYNFVLVTWTVLIFEYVRALPAKR